MTYCRRCGKVVYWTRSHATNAARRVTDRYGRKRKHKMRVYRDARCGVWHITRTKTLSEIREKVRATNETRDAHPPK